VRPFGLHGLSATLRESRTGLAGFAKVEAMNVRFVVAAVAVAALAFAGYQAALVFSSARASEPSAAAAPAPPAPAASGASAPVGGTAPYAAKAADQYAAGADAPFDPAVARRITVEQVKARLDKGDKILFVDTRADIPDVMIRGAVQVPEDKLDTWARTVSKNALIVIYCTCADEATAAREVIALQKSGFRRAYALRDGLAAWQADDLPTEQPRRGPAN
jgi:rhodanese-related sulfurtransferase